MLATAGVGVVAFIVFSGLARPLKSPAPAVAEIERIIVLAGFGLSQVSLTGHRYTLDSDVFDAIGLQAAHTMLSFDVDRRANASSHVLTPAAAIAAAIAIL